MLGTVSTFYDVDAVLIAVSANNDDDGALNDAHDDVVHLDDADALNDAHT